MKSEFDLSVIISARNESELLSLTIQSIQVALRELNAEIIVVDDASDSPFKASPALSNLTIIRNSKREGCSRSRQIGVNEAKGRYLCFPDAHMAFPREHFSRLVKALEIHPDSILGTALYDTSSFDEFMSCVTTGTWKRAQPCIYGYRLNMSPTIEVAALFEPAAQEPYIVPSVAGATLALARTLFVDLGGFENQLLEAGNGEDLELCLKSRAFGHEIVMIPTLCSLHYSSPDTARRRKLVSSGIIPASSYYDGGAKNALRILYLHLPEKEISTTFERFRAQENLSFAPETAITEELRAKRRQIDARRVRSHEWVLSKACNQVP